MLKIDIKKNSNKKEININRKINLNEKTTNKKEDNKMFFYKTVYVIFLITVAIIGTYYIFKDIDQRKKVIIEKEVEHIVEKKIINEERYIRNYIRLDNNIYSNNLKSVYNKIGQYYGDYEFARNLEPFFNILSKIQIPSNNRIYEFEIKGMLSEYGNFSYNLYGTTGINEFDTFVKNELDRFRNIRFREQSKDVHFYFTITNRYNLIK